MSDARNCVVLKSGTTEAHVKGIRLALETLQFNFSDVQHAFFKAQDETSSVVFYRSGKIVIQGRSSEELLVQLRCEVDFELEESQEPGKKSKSPAPVVNQDECIGIDESGKGDFFGPLVVAAVFVDRKMAGVLREYGVQDSKNISDGQIKKLSSLITANCPHSVIYLRPEKYNQLYESFGNLNRLLAWAHATSLEDVLGKVTCGKAISDQFAKRDVVSPFLKERGRQIVLEQTPKAERFISVAAASIVARHRFVHGLAELSEMAGVTLPKGCGQGVVELGRRLMSSGRQELFPSIAKLHFKTYESLMG